MDGSSSASLGAICEKYLLNATEILWGLLIDWLFTDMDLVVVWIFDFVFPI